MVNLIYKEIWLMKKKMAIYSILCLGLFLFVKVIEQDLNISNILIVGVGILFSYFMTMLSFEVEGKNKAEAIIVTLPYIRSDIIRAKYSSLLLLSVLFYALCGLITISMTWIKGGASNYSGIIVGLIGSVIVHAFMIPVFVRFEYVKAANVMMLLYMGIAAFVALIAKNIDRMHNIAVGLQDISKMRIAIIVGILLVVSYLISNYIYEKKEFY